MMDLFSPLSNDSTNCDYFYVLSIIGFIIIVMSVMIAIIVIITLNKKLNYTILLNLIMLMVNGFLIYYSNRLLYTMCLKII